MNNFFNDFLSEKTIEKLNELEQLIEQYPNNIPLPECAKFLHINPSTLRNYLDSGNCPFGFSTQKKKYGNHNYTIPSPQFDIWYRMTNFGAVYFNYGNLAVEKGANQYGASV